MSRSRVWLPVGGRRLEERTRSKGVSSRTEGEEGAVGLLLLGLEVRRRRRRRKEGWAEGRRKLGRRESAVEGLKREREG